MQDDNHIATLRSQLKQLRAKATRLGEIDRMIDKAYDNLDVDCALYWERVSASYVEDRSELAERLMDTEYSIIEAGAKVPNPSWVEPQWVERERIVRINALIDEMAGYNPEAWKHYEAGKEHMQQEEFNEAVEEFSKYIELFPRMADAFIGRGIAYCVMDQFERGFDDFNEAIRLQPDNAGAYCNRGLAWFELEHPERALEDYDKAIRLDPEEPAFLENKGLLCLSQGDLVQALQCYDEASRLAPKQADIYESRADVYQQMGLDVLAEQDRARARYLRNRKRPKTRSD